MGPTMSSLFQYWKYAPIILTNAFFILSVNEEEKINIVVFLVTDPPRAEFTFWPYPNFTYKIPKLFCFIKDCTRRTLGKGA